jgi:predicted tellurium resistance membrane protein TerC
VAMNKRPYPDHMYVDIATVTKSISATILFVCAFSLVISFLTQFTIINRYVSVTIGFAAIAFYLMGGMLRQSQKRK